MDNGPLLLCFSIYITTSALDYWKSYIPNSLPSDRRLLSGWMGEWRLLKDH